MSIVFFGSPDFALPTLKALIDAEETVAAVVTQPDKPKGRGGKRQPCAVRSYALEQGIKSLSPLDMKDEAFIAELEGYHPEFFVVVAYGRILTPKVLSIPKLGPINVHASLLPAYRGAAPVCWALMDGLKETGVTTMFMDEGLDTGDILLQKTMPIEKDDTTGTLGAKLAEAGGPLLMDTLRGLREGSLKPRPQGKSTTEYARMLVKEDGHLDWDKGAAELHNTVRALSPWPSAYSFLDGKRIKITQSKPLNEAPPADSAPGAIVNVTAESFEVATGNGMLSVRGVQPEGKRAMSVRDFLQGHKLTRGAGLE